jgi:hypothetical protein
MGKTFRRDGNFRPKTHGKTFNKDYKSWKKPKNPKQPDDFATPESPEPQKNP